jgi:hypothetical protein
MKNEENSRFAEWVSEFQMHIRPRVLDLGCFLPVLPSGYCKLQRSRLSITCHND